jgi:hypothetical protein
MLKEILCVSGKPGLFKLVQRAKTMFILESLADGKKMPAYVQDKIIALNDVLVYTQKENVPLREVFEKMQAHTHGNLIDVLPSSLDNDELREWFAQILPDFDRQRVYPSDIRKLMNWYNQLVRAKIIGPPQDVAEAPENVADSPEKETDSPENVANSPENVANAPEKENESPENVADTPEENA